MSYWADIHDSTDKQLENLTYAQIFFTFNSAEFRWSVLCIRVYPLTRRLQYEQGITA